MKDLRGHIESGLKFVELVQFLESSVVQGVGQRAEMKSSPWDCRDMIYSPLA